MSSRGRSVKASITSSLLIMLVAALTPGASDALPSHRKPCDGLLNASGKTFVVEHLGVPCKGAKGKTRILVESNGNRIPARFTCRSPVSFAFQAVCRVANDPRGHQFAYYQPLPD